MTELHSQSGSDQAFNSRSRIAHKIVGQPQRSTESNFCAFQATFPSQFLTTKITGLHPQSGSGQAFKENDCLPQSTIVVGQQLTGQLGATFLLSKQFLAPQDKAHCFAFQLFCFSSRGLT